ncbi:L,D-transpeptidase [Candidatus Saganbacteria bacterium]|nr:L,D-transpeptidase [Candidatus Saganbacteria bacterium]
MKKKAILVLSAYILIFSGVAAFKTLSYAPEVAPAVNFVIRHDLDSRVREIADRYSNGDVIVVSKRDHLLYYCRKGLIVSGDRWGGFVFNFPVPVALGANNRWTPEGRFTVYTKNDRSRYTLFLGFLGQYGIHGAETRLASRLNFMESLNPNYAFVTKKDNTRGCVAVENRVIKYLFAQVQVDTPVIIMR